eukprot:255280_1
MDKLLWVVCLSKIFHLLVCQQEIKSVALGWNYNGDDTYPTGNGAQAMAQWTGLIMDFCVQRSSNGEIGSLKYKCTQFGTQVQALTISYYSNEDCSGNAVITDTRDFSNSKNNMTCYDGDYTDKSLFGYGIVRVYNKQLVDGTDNSCVPDTLNWEEFPVLTQSCYREDMGSWWRWTEIHCESGGGISFYIYTGSGGAEDVCPRFHNGVRLPNDGIFMYNNDGCVPDVYGNFPYKVIECVEPGSAISYNKLHTLIVSTLIGLLSFIF